MRRYRCTGVCAPSLMTCCRQLLPCDLSGMLPSFSHMPGDLPCANVMDLAVDAAAANVTYKRGGALRASRSVCSPLPHPSFSSATLTAE